MKVPIAKSSLIEAVGTMATTQSAVVGLRGGEVSPVVVGQSRRHFAGKVSLQSRDRFLVVAAPNRNASRRIDRTHQRVASLESRNRGNGLRQLAFAAPQWHPSSVLCRSRLVSSPLTDSVALLQESLPPPSSSSPTSQLAREQDGDDLCNMLARAAVLQRVLSEDVLLSDRLVGKTCSDDERTRTSDTASFAPMAASLCLGIREEEASQLSSLQHRQVGSNSSRKSLVRRPGGGAGGAVKSGDESMSDHVIHSLVSQLVSLASSGHTEGIEMSWETAVSLGATLAPEDILAVEIMERAVSSGSWRDGASQRRSESTSPLPSDLERCCVQAVREHPSLAPALWMALSKYLRDACASEPRSSSPSSATLSVEHALALHMPSALLDATVSLFCDGNASCVLASKEGTSDAAVPLPHTTFQSPHSRDDNHAKTATGAVSNVFGSNAAAEVHVFQTSGTSYFCDVWNRTIDELVEYALAVFSTAISLLEGPLSTGKHAKGDLRAVRQSTERVLRSFGRMVGALRKRRCLGAVAELHSRLVALGAGAAAADLVELSARHKGNGELTRVLQPHLPLQCPRVRQCTMIDAYTLLTLGHLADTAPDLNERTVEYGKHLMQHIAWLLGSFSRSKSSNGTELVVDSNGAENTVSSQDRALMTRMEESLRVATKILLRSGDFSSITTLYAACPEMGPCWEVGVALAASGSYRDAMRVYAGFLATTRVAFASNGLPAYVRGRLFETIAAGVHAELLRAWEGYKAAIASSASDSVAVQVAAIGAAVESIAQLNEVVRQWQSAIHPAVVFREMMEAFTTVPDAILNTRNDELREKESSASRREISDTLENPSTPELSVREEEEVDDMDMHTNTSLATREIHQFLFLVGCGCVRRVCSVHSHDGLLVKVVKSIVQLYISAASACELAAPVESYEFPPSSALSKAALMDEFYNILTSIHQSVPYVPVLRTALIALVERGAPRDAAELLLRAAGQSNKSKLVLASLQEMPLIALQGLQRACDTLEESQGADLNRNDSGDAFRDQLVLSSRSLVSEALGLREAADQARNPWKCFFCNVWNNKFSKTCKVCSAQDMAVWVCPKCSTFSSTTSESCLVCGHHRTPARSTEDADEKRDTSALIIPLRAWRCDSCASENDAMLPFYCKSCGQTRSEVKPILEKTAFHCSGCEHFNAQGSLRPWCSACGKLKPSVAESAGNQAVMWRCVECLQWNPWLSTHCLSCEDGGKPASATRLEVAPWFQWHCGACTESNAAWMRTCRSCGRSKADEVDGEVAQVRERSAVKPTRMESSTLPYPAATPAAIKSHAHESETTSVLCTHCFSPVAEDSPVCLTCFTVQRTARTSTPTPQTPSVDPKEECMLWVCLRNNCMEVNLSTGSIHSSEFSCTRCGQPQGLLTSMTYQSNPLAYINTSSTSSRNSSSRLFSQGTAPSNRANRAASPSASTPAALQLSLPVDSVACETCGSPMDARNVSNVCRHCLTCSPSTVPHVSSRVLLPVMQRTLERAHRGSMDPSDAVSLVRSIVRVLAAAEEATLPWQGRDLENGMLCGLSQRYPVLPSGEVHSTIQSVAELIRTCCDVSQSISDQGVRSPQSRVWLCVALDLVDLVNASTDFDELGFETLASLCTAIRPHQREHIRRETRWTFLRDMKLSRESIVNGVACSHCLAPLKAASSPSPSSSLTVCRKCASKTD